MKIFPPKNLLLFFLSVPLLIISLSCSGGGTLVAGGGIDGSGIISRGAITAFGSIIVKGTEFDTSNAVIIVDGTEAGIGDIAVLDNLDIGRVVTVEGSVAKDATGFIADRVIYSNNIEGPVESINSIDAKTKEIIVLGQTVILNVNTVFKDTSFEEIALDEVVEVSGLNDEKGTVWATFIGKTGVLIPGLEVEVTGYVSNLDSSLMTFYVNDLRVDYQSADSSRLPDGILTEGMLVEVDGILDETGEMLLASAIELEDGLIAENADQLEITGFVTKVNSTTEFMVGNQVVVIEPVALFVDGIPEDITAGVMLEIEGSLIDGILYTWEIEFWETDQVEVEDLVSSITSPAEFTVGDQVIQTNHNTVFDGGTPDDIVLGVLLEIKGVPTDIDFSTIIADKVSFFEKE